MGSSSERTRTAITAALKKKLKDIMGEFSALRQKLQLEYRWRPACSCMHRAELPQCLVTPPLPSAQPNPSHTAAFAKYGMTCSHEGELLSCLHVASHLSCS